MSTKWNFLGKNAFFSLTQSAGAVEYADSISAESYLPAVRFEMVIGVGSLSFYGDNHLEVAGLILTAGE